MRIESNSLFNKCLLKFGSISDKHAENTVVDTKDMISIPWNLQPIEGEHSTNDHIGKNV